MAQLLVGKDIDLDVNARDKGGKTLLHLAAENGWKDKVELLLAKGADVNATATYKDMHRFFSDGTALHLTRSPEVARLLIAKGANVNARDKEGKTPLHILYTHLGTFPKSMLEVAKVLIANGADVNAKDTQGRTPLHTVVTAPWYINTKDLVELLIAKGADVNARDKEGKTPLHKVQSLEAAKLLIANGASLNARANQGNTPLHSAAN